MRERLFGKVLSVALSAAMIFTSVVPSYAKEGVEGDFTEEIEITDESFEDEDYAEDSIDASFLVDEDQVEIKEKDDEEIVVFDEEEAVSEVDPLGYYGDTIILDANGGKFKDGESTKTVSIYTQLFSLLGSYKPNLEGKLFKGWYEEPECVNAIDCRTNYYRLLSSFFEDGKRLYAKFSDYQTVTIAVHVSDNNSYFLNNYYEDTDLDDDESDVNSGKFDTLYITSKVPNDDNTYLLSEFILTNRLKNSEPRAVYSGLYYDKDLTKKVAYDKDFYDYSIECDGNIDLYVKFEYIAKLLTFDLNSPTGYWYINNKRSTENQTFAAYEEDQYFDPPYVHNSDLHYKFLGWSVNKDAIVPDEGYYIDEKDQEEWNSIYGTFTEDTTLYAVWEKVIVVTYDLNSTTGYFYEYSHEDEDGNEVYKRSTENKVRRSDSFVDPDIVKNSDLHYEFLGWSVNKDAINPDIVYDYENEEYKYAATFTGFTEDTTLFAVWNKNYKKDIVFDLNSKTGYFCRIEYEDDDEGGTVEKEIKSSDSIIYLTDGSKDNYELPFVYNSDRHYLFLGWSRNRDAVEPEFKANYEDASITAAFTESTTLYAVWDKTYYKDVIFDLNSDTGYFRSEEYDYDIDDYKVVKSTDPIRYYTDGSEDCYELPNVYNRDRHYLFLGWSRNKDAEVPEFKANYEDASITASFTENTTLYAVWDKTAYCIVTFDGGEGTFVLGDPDDNPERLSTYSFTVEKGSSISDGLYLYFPSNPTCDTNKLFVGWYIGDIKVGYEIPEDYIVKEDTTLVAKFAEPITVTFDANGGSFGDEEETTYIVKHPKGDKLGEIIPELNVPDGKRFTGWFTKAEDGDEIADISNYIATEDITIYAQFAEKEEELIPVEDPVADIASGSTVKLGSMISLSTKTPDAEIFYTLDGTDPATSVTGSTKKYEGPIEVNDDITIKAIALKSGMKTSDVVTFVYMVERDWGDIDDTIKTEIFGGDYHKIPAEMWYLIDGKFYESADKFNADDFSKIYTGNSITFNDEIVVFNNTSKLLEKSDYTVNYENNINKAGESDAKVPSFTINGQEKYSSQVKFTFEIKAEDINNAKITSEKIETVIAGKTKLSSIKPVVTYNDKVLTPNKDYTLTYESGVSGSTVLDGSKKEYTISITGKNNFAGTMNDKVTVKVIDKNSKTVVQAKKLKVVDAKGKALTANYSGKAVDVIAMFDNSAANNSAKAFVKDGKKTLTYGKDYTIEIANGDFTSAGKHTYIVRGIEKDNLANGEKNYIGTKTCTLTIKGILISNVKIYGLKSKVAYSGNSFELQDLFNSADKKLAGRKAVTLYDANAKKDLVPGIDYEVSYENNTGALGNFNVVFTGKNGYSGTVKKVVNVKAAKLSKDSLTITVNGGNDVTYVKPGAKPEVTVALKSGKKLVQNTDYKVTYKNNKKISSASKKASVVIKGIGNYKGTSVTQTFNIVATDPSKITLSVKDINYNKKGKKGYALVTPKFMDNGKTVTVGKNKDIDAIDTNAYEYVNITTGKTLTKNHTAAEVNPGDIIQVSVTIKCSGNSPYNTNGAAGTTATLTGTYKVKKK